MRGCGCGGAASASTQLSNVLSGSPSGPGRRGGLSVLAANQLRLCGGLLAFWQRRPANPFLRSAFDPFFCFRGAELSASSVFLPSSRCNTAHRVRRHVKSWFGATPCRRATKLPSCPCPVSSGAISISHAMISMPRPAVTVLLGAGGNRISRRLRFTEERPRSTPRGRALRRLQDQVTDSRLERALAHSCIRHIV